MQYSASPLYHSLPADIGDRLSQAIHHGLGSAEKAVPLFFRADDIGVPSKSFAKMTELFTKYRIPLCLAVVPAWLTAPRVSALKKEASSTELFCWHQHGWRHKNHEPSGKKQEFGDNRTTEAVFNDIKHGRDRLAEILRDDFYPIFTPPWNRCGSSALESLSRLSFKGISRSTAAFPPSPSGLPDYQINIDLHTRKEADPRQSLELLLSELSQALSSALPGIMLHHQRMNSSAFDFLELLLNIMSREKRILALTFKELDSIV